MSLVNCMVKQHKQHEHIKDAITQRALLIVIALFLQVRERLMRMGPLQPMNIFLRQEIDRMQRVIELVRNTLSDLKLAIDGTIIMSENLRDALDCMYDARIPERWKKVIDHQQAFIRRIYLSPNA